MFRLPDTLTALAGNRRGVTALGARLTDTSPTISAAPG